MTSKLFWLVLGGTIFGLCVRAEPQQPNIHKIGWLSAGSSANPGQQEIVRNLRDLGYVNGHNITFEFRYASNRLDQLPLLAEELVSRKVDVLITPGRQGRWLFGMLPRQSQSFSQTLPIQLEQDWLRA
jgi:putative tryptophan/tyrosine transport system substrate-binding protein